MDQKKRLAIVIGVFCMQILLVVLIGRSEGDSRQMLTLAMFFLMGISYLALSVLQKKAKDTPAPEEPEKKPADLQNTPSHLNLMDSFSGSIYMVVRDSQKFLFMKIGGEIRGITVETLPEAKMYSEAALNDMGIKHFFLGREEIRGYRYNEKPSVATNWNNCGTLKFLGKQKKSFVILDQLAPHQVHRFLSGVLNATPERVSTRNRLTRERETQENKWLEKNQDAVLGKKMNAIGMALSVYSYLVAGLFLFVGRPYKLLSLACMAGCVACIALEILFPAYFTMIEAKKDAEKRGSKPRFFLLMPFFILLAALDLRTLMDFSYLSWTGIIIGTVVVTGIIAVILGRFALEFRNWRIDSAALIVLLLIFCTGIVGQVNYLLDFSKPEIFYTEVVDHHISSGKTTNYYCTVILENGEEFDVQVSKDMYQHIDVGNWVKITTRSGGLGIEYVAITG